MLQQAMSSTHVFFYKLSGGRIGGRIHKADVLLLTTTGRKTGKKRTTPLLYVRDGNRLVIIASNGGRPIDPSWWMNLKRNPIAMVQVKSLKETIYAQRAIGSEKERLWRLMTNVYPAYDNYLKKTDRDIPVVVLMPKTA
ncbi:nitroreductase family deazaflavin-dependent oxidoreductase [Candidatus Bathyarchaeota archaeon]|nr:MAG: nitroreductase family deazaflavin-dependent oxidoreductase [Candidatus Bathyarchaeota archaeon]